MSKGVERYERIEISISDDGTAVATYRVEGAKVNGRHQLDEDVSDWPDNDIKDEFARQLCIEPDQMSLIDFDRD